MSDGTSFDLVAVANQKRSQGQFAEASDLFEKLCHFSEAAACALDAADPSRALVLAAFANDEPLQKQAIASLARTPAKAHATVALLEARGHCRCAGHLALQLADYVAAGALYLRSSEWILAAAAYQKAGDDRQAARALESGLRAAPDNADLLMAMGEILLAHGKFEAALKHLQRIQPSCELRERALSQMLPCFEALSMTSAAHSAQQELKDLRPRTNSAIASAAPLPSIENKTAQVIVGRYEVLREVACSANARVFAAKDRLRNQKVAIKQIVTSASTGAGRDALGRLIREAQVLERVRGANIVPLVEILSDSGIIATQWMEGGSLAELMVQQVLSPAKAAEIAYSVLGALAEAHRLGILHRDIKPSNILFDASGASYLADFGAAHLSDSSATATAGVIGTLSYMSPEQQQGKPATCLSDVYGLGVVFYEMLCQALPEDGDFAPPSSVNAELGIEHDQVVLGLLAKEPSHRTPDAISARQLISSLRWTNQVPQRTERVPRARTSSGFGQRLQKLADGSYFDSWLGRQVQLEALTEDSLERAREVARHRHVDGLQVLRVDRESGEIWYTRVPNLASP
jgi:serine/threonine-protein kinase